MISKEMLVEAIAKEVKTIKHLADKILPETYHWKPTASQRSLLELLQYLSHIGGTYSQMLQTGKTDHFGQNAKDSEALTPEHFNTKMDAQLAIVTDTINGMSDEEAQKTMEFFGGTVVTKAWIVFFLLQNLIAYRMQLFLYLKQSGREELNTFNNWMGMDQPANNS